jgi:HEAT repeat protein
LSEALRDVVGEVRLEAAWAIGKLGDAALPALAAALHDKHWDIRRAVADGLGRMSDKAAVRVLVTALHDENKWVRQQAAEALGRLGNAQALPALTEALNDPNPDVRRNVIHALASIALKVEDSQPRDVFLNVVKSLLVANHDPDVKPHCYDRLRILGPRASCTIIGWPDKLS